MVPRQGAGSDPRSEGSVRVAAGLCRLERACGAGRRAPAPPRGRRGEAPRGRAVPAAATRASAAALAAAAAGAESVAAAGRLLGVEQHLRSHACFLKRSSPNCAPSDVSAARLPRHPPSGCTLPPPAPSLLSRAQAGRRLAARGAGEFSARGLGRRRADSGAQHRVRAGGPPTLIPLCVVTTQIREPQRDLPEGHSCAETEGCSTLPPSPLQIMEGIHGVIKKKNRLKFNPEK